jgi:hypothetical protein
MFQECDVFNQLVVVLCREKDSLSVLVSAGVKFCHANLIRRKKDPLHSCGVGEFHDKVLFWRV